MLALGSDAPSTDELERAAQSVKMDLRVVRIPQNALRDLYEAPLVLIRPDQIVAWRGASDKGAQQILSQVMGHGQLK